MPPACSQWVPRVGSQPRFGARIGKTKMSSAPRIATEILSNAPYLAKDQTMLTDLVRASRRIKMKALSIRIFLMTPGLLMGPF